MKNLKIINFDNIYLARIVTFSPHTFLFYSNEIDLPFQTEEYGLVFVCNDWAYDLSNNNRYKIIKYIDKINLVNIYPNIKYVDTLYPFNDVYKNLKIYICDEELFREIMFTNANISYQLHQLLNGDNKVIDLVKIKKLLNERK